VSEAVVAVTAATANTTGWLRSQVAVAIAGLVGGALGIGWLIHAGLMHV